MERNVVQVEFFHFGDYPRLKTTVRIFDTTGELTRLSLASVKLESQTTKLLSKYQFATTLRKWFIARRLRRLGKKIYKLGNRTVFTATKLVLDALNTSPQEVAVENSDRTFRICLKNEIEDLKGASRSSSGLWLFVFRSDQLLLDKYEPVAYMM